MVILIIIFRLLSETTDQFRLISGASSHEGVVQIWTDGGWGVLCDSGWGDEESDVTCRQLGWSVGTANEFVFINHISEDVLVRNYACEGDEDLLNDCPNVNNGISCRPEDAAQVYCDLPKGRK